MLEYAGNWLECRNRNCGFPTRVPYSCRTKKVAGRTTDSAPFLFACPVCLHINPYENKELRRVRFRWPDPYKTGKLVLYSALVGCAHPLCPTELTIFTPAASTVSLAALLGLWKSWTLDIQCGRHRFRMRNNESWWIQEEKSLAGADC